jgi:hypothetical protein
LSWTLSPVAHSGPLIIPPEGFPEEAVPAEIDQADMATGLTKGLAWDFLFSGAHDEI